MLVDIYPIDDKKASIVLNSHFLSGMSHSSCLIVYVLFQVCLFYYLFAIFYSQSLLFWFLLFDTSLLSNVVDHIN